MSAATSNSVERRPEAASVFGRWSAASSVALVTALGLAIRTYLLVFTYCISGDGASYIAMAQQFAGGRYATALTSVFSPLYPALIALIHPLCPNWETAGSVVSLVLGTALISVTYLLMRDVFGRCDVAMGAAALAAIHPDLASYSVSVRTEAGYMMLLTLCVFLAIKALERRRLWLYAAAGIIGGIAYLYRTEAVGILVVVAGVLLALPALKRSELIRSMAGWAVFALSFLLMASPYLIYLHASSGHWMVGREMAAAVTYGLSDASTNKAAWRALAYSDQTSIVKILLEHPALYSRKVAGDFMMSFYYFAEAVGFVLVPFLILGWRERGWRLLRYPEILLTAVVSGFFCAFALTYTGARFMVHLVPLCLGWTALGMESVIAAVGKISFAGKRLKSPGAVCAVAIALMILPQTLWPVGYDMRGFRYAAAEIDKHPGRGAIVESDGRPAFYAGRASIPLPALGADQLCQWAAAQPNAQWLLVSRHEEVRIGRLSDLPCLEPIKRYPRTRGSYYDLFAFRSFAEESSRP